MPRYAWLAKMVKVAILAQLDAARRVAGDRPRDLFQLQQAALQARGWPRCGRRLTALQLHCNGKTIRSPGHGPHASENGEANFPDRAAAWHQALGGGSR